MTTSLITRLPARLAALAVGAALTTTGLAAAGAPAHAATLDAYNPTSVTGPNQWFERENTLDIHIPDSGPADVYPGTNTFAGVPGVITDLSVWVSSVSHSHLDDLDVMLVGPTGIKIKLWSDAGGGAISGKNLVFTNYAASAIPDNSTPANQVVLPSDYPPDDTFPAPAPTASGAATSLTAFNGTNPNGTWKLYVNDDFAGDQGLISGWTVSVKTTVEPAASPVAVANLPGPVTDVDVDLRDFTAFCAEDADIMLVGPQGQRSMLMSDTADCNDTPPVNLRIDDEAVQPFGTTVPVTGSYRPTNVNETEPDLMGGLGNVSATGTALSVFDGTNGNGTWQLYVMNDAPETFVKLNGGWGLHITTTDPVTGAPTTTTTTTTTTTSGTSTAKAPRVSSSAPKAGSKGVKRAAIVKATFSTTMRASSLTGTTVRLLRKGSATVVKAKVTYVAASRTVVLDPVKRLAPAATYRFIVTTTAKSRAGLALDQSSTKAGNQRFAMTFRTR